MLLWGAAIGFLSAVILLWVVTWKANLVPFSGLFSRKMMMDEGELGPLIYQLSRDVQRLQAAVMSLEERVRMNGFAAGGKSGVEIGGAEGKAGSAAEAGPGMVSANFLGAGSEAAEDNLESVQAAGRASAPALAAIGEREMIVRAGKRRSSSSVVGRGALIKHRVYECQRKGMEVEEIARELNLGKGELALILTFSEKGEKKRRGREDARIIYSSDSAERRTGEAGGNQ